MSDLLKDLAEVVRKKRAFEDMSDTARNMDKSLSDASHSAYMFIYHHHATIQQNAEDAAKYRNDGSTHAEGCYACGPKHYECALRKLREGAEATKRLRALERAIIEFGAITGQLDDAASISKRAYAILREGEPHDQD